MPMEDDFSIESTLKEKRRFKPDSKFSRKANIAGQAAYNRLVKDRNLVRAGRRNIASP